MVTYPLIMPPRTRRRTRTQSVRIVPLSLSIVTSVDEQGRNVRLFTVVVVVDVVLTVLR